MCSTLGDLQAVLVGGWAQILFKEGLQDCLPKRLHLIGLQLQWHSGLQKVCREDPVVTQQMSTIGMLFKNAVDIA